MVGLGVRASVAAGAVAVAVLAGLVTGIRLEHDPTRHIVHIRHNHVGHPLDQPDLLHGTG